MPKRKSKPRPKRRPEFRLRLTPADRKWHATVTKHAERKYPSVGAFLRQAITVLYAIETRPPNNVITATITDNPMPSGTTTAAMVPGMWRYTQSDPAADSLTHPEE